MADNEESNSATEDSSARLRRVIQHADASIARWSVEKRRDATITFYSRSSDTSVQTCNVERGGNKRK